MYKTKENYKMENARFAEGKAFRVLEAKMALLVFILIPMLAPTNLNACTGIRLGTDATGFVYGRTMEWGGFDLKSQILVVPRGYTFPGNIGENQKGKSFTVKYGFVGVNLQDRDIIMDGMNEQGLAAGGFYHHHYAEYPEYSSEDSSSTISSAYVVNYILANFGSVIDVILGLNKVKIVREPINQKGYDADVHWMVTDQTGSSIVIEFEKGIMNVYPSTLGVITNDPYYDWHITNLSNYINLRKNPASEVTLTGHSSSDKLPVSPLGAGSGLLGLPGDNTPPSRFIRATVWSQTARDLYSANDAVFELFRILDNFQLPLGADASEGSSTSPSNTPNADKKPELKISGMKSDTQWTTAWNLTDRVFNYHTQYNRQVRRLDLKEINFTPQDSDPPVISTIPLDIKKEQEVQKIALNDSHWRKED